MPGTSFHSHPPELRNHIYHLTASTKLHQCSYCLAFRSSPAINSELSLYPITARGVPMTNIYRVSACHPFRACCGTQNQRAKICIEFSTQDGVFFWLNRRTDLAKEGLRIEERLAY